MCDEWMPTIRLAMSIEEFHRLPRNAAYKYEYFDHAAQLSPQPKTMHAVLDITAWSAAAGDLAPEAEFEIGQLREADSDILAQLFAGAFAQTQPFASVSDFERLPAAQQCLRRAFAGEEGPWIGDASFVARSRMNNAIVGAIVVTLCPDDDYHWREPPPPDLYLRGGGRPHITWIFTHAWHKGHGIGTRLLDAAVAPLRRHGYRHLHTTFIAGNDSSMLWHWRNGFRLLPYAASKRRMRQKIKAESIPAEGADSESDRR